MVTEKATMKEVNLSFVFLKFSRNDCECKFIHNDYAMEIN